LGEPLSEADNSLVDIVLEFHRIVKSDLRFKGVFCLLRRVGGFYKPLERAYGIIVHLALFRTTLVFLLSFWAGIKKLSKGTSGS
jgi:hypothetical protein